MTGSTLAVIPARLGSTRLPRKPLHIVAGRPLLEWVWRRVSTISLFDLVVVATDSEEVAAQARLLGARVELTSAAHPSGTDRVAEVARRPEYAQFPWVVNVQGDEPFVESTHLADALRLVRDEGWDVGTVATPIASREEWRNPSVVKVVRGTDGAALYFSRAPIPFVSAGEPTPDDFRQGDFLRHHGVYAYRAAALQRWVGLPEGALERLERLEQLRALAAGLRIGVAVGESVEGGIDTIDDVARAELRLRAG